MKTILAGSNDQYAEVEILNTDGTAKADVTDATVGLTIKYQVGNGTVGTLTPAAMTANGAHVDGGIYHVGDGRYKIGLSDAVVATAADLVTVWTELTDTKCVADRIRVVGYDPLATELAADVKKIDGNLVAAMMLRRSASVIGLGTIDTSIFTPTATQFEAADIVENDADFWTGRIAIFISGSLTGQARAITGYSIPVAFGRFTVDALTAVPAEGDEFIIV